MRRPSDEGREVEVDLKLDTGEVDEGSELKTPESSARDLYVKGKDIMKYGGTLGCKACEHFTAKKSSKSPAHAPRCRQRMKKLMEKDDADKHRVVRADNRRWEEVERIGEGLLKNIEEEADPNPLQSSGSGIDNREREGGDQAQR